MTSSWIAAINMNFVTAISSVRCWIAEVIVLWRCLAALHSQDDSPKIELEMEDGFQPIHTRICWIVTRD
jgi:hypothetical protein